MDESRMDENREQPSHSGRSGKPARGRGHVAGERVDRRTFSSWPLLVLLALAFSGLFGLAAMMIDVLFDGRATFTGGTAVMMFAAFVGFLLVVGIVRRDMNIAPD